MSNQNNSDIEPNIQDATVQNKKRKRSAACNTTISESSRNVIEFLKSCEPYQADAARVIAVFAEDKSEPYTFTEGDAYYVNYFLNTGVDIDKFKSVDDLENHRKLRMQQLLKSCEEFCEKTDLSRVMIALMNLAIDKNVCKSTFEQMKTRANNR